MGADAASVIDRHDLRVRVDTAGGPGGQHANRTKSRVVVELDLRTARLDEDVRARLRSAFGNVVRSTSSTSRSQTENRRRAEERLLARIEDALRVAKARRRTAPSRAAAERRIDEKRRRGSIKRLRGSAEDD